jgi:hypothetical protein
MTRDRSLKKSNRFDQGGWEAVTRRRNLVAVDVENFDEAMRLAREIAGHTGRSVTVRDAEMIELEVVPAPARN